MPYCSLCGVEVDYNVSSSQSITNDNTFYLGREGSFYMDGLRTQDALFDDVLTSTEINDIMDNGLEGGAAPPTVVNNWYWSDG